MCGFCGEDVDCLDTHVTTCELIPVEEDHIYERPENDLIERIQVLQGTTTSDHDFVALSYAYAFLADHYGFDKQQSRVLIQKLKRNGRIMIGSVPNPKGRFPTSTITVV